MRGGTARIVLLAAAVGLWAGCGTSSDVFLGFGDGGPDTPGGATDARHDAALPGAPDGAGGADGAAGPLDGKRDDAPDGGAPARAACSPCAGEEECPGAALRCAPFGAGGERFCLAVCDPAAGAEDPTCAAGFHCAPLAAEPGAGDGGDGDDEAPGVCQPDSGSCDCTPAQAGRARPCTVENEWGLCRGWERCDDGLAWSACDAPAPAGEACNDADDDCDGQTDEGFPGKGDPCDSADDQDVCAFGTLLCGPDGASLVCVGDPPREEICNDVDDDCDGMTDEGFPGKGEPCDDGDPDVCAYGVWACTADGTRLRCIGDGDEPERCNGRDDDCDGEVDEGFDDLDGDTRADCVDPDDDGDGDWDTTDCAPADPAIHAGAEELCNAVDDDCDGVTDGVEEPCPSECGDGRRRCTDGVWGECAGTKPTDCLDYATCTVVTQCVTACPAAPPEVCDGGAVDEDCDGETDEEDAQGCQTLFLDGDADGWGVAADWRCLCQPEGFWRATRVGDCDDEARQINPGVAEVCNHKDDDCDGTADGFSVGCASECGEGRATCTDGEWGPCSTPAPLACVDWATCAVESVCAAECAPAPEEQCNGQDDDCDEAADETFECALGAEALTPCGRCGTATAVCGAGCAWGAPGACTGEGPCTPGETAVVSCGGCGTRTRVCTDACQWDDGGACAGACVCSPGQTETVACGSCGTKTRACTDQCAWGDYGACTGQGVCTPGATQSAACGNCGTQTRTCTAQCTWGTYGSCTGQGVCTPGTTQAGGCDVCAQKTCQSNCQWSGCALKPGATCLYEGGTNYRCCGTHRWQFCLPPSYGAAGCKWSPDCVYVSNACGK